MAYVYLNCSEKDTEILPFISDDLEDTNHTLWKYSDEDEIHPPDESDT